MQRLKKGDDGLWLHGVCTLIGKINFKLSYTNKYTIKHFDKVSDEKLRSMIEKRWSNLDWRKKHLFEFFKNTGIYKVDAPFREIKQCVETLCNVRKILIFSREWKLGSETGASLVIENMREEAGKIGASQVMQGLVRYVSGLALFW